MSKFTKGKWEVEIIYGDHYTVFANEHLVADCFSSEANARLIAAAPEMYQHLKLILNGEFSSDDVEQLLARIDGEAENE